MNRNWQRFLTVLAGMASISVLACSGDSSITGIKHGAASATSTPGTRAPDTTVVVPPGPPPLPTGPGPAVSVALLPDTLTLRVGYVAGITARALNAQHQIVGGETVVWSTSDASIATVRDTGLVAGIGVGMANITATIDGISATARVTVLPRYTAVSLFDIAGTVLGVESGQDTTHVVPVAGAAVSVFRVAPADSSGAGSYPSNDLVATVTADASGHFSVNALSAAWYRISVAAPSGSGYQNAETLIAPPDRALVSISVLLRSSP